MATSELDAASVGAEPDPTLKVSVGRQALRREVNERIKDLNAGWGTDQLDLFCECGRVHCAARVTVTAADFDEVRRVPTQFLVLRDHASPANRVVAAHDSFVILDRVGVACTPR